MRELKIVTNESRWKLAQEAIARQPLLAVLAVLGVFVLKMAIGLNAMAHVSSFVDENDDARLWIDLRHAVIWIALFVITQAVYGLIAAYGHHHALVAAPAPRGETRSIDRDRIKTFMKKYMLFSFAFLAGVIVVELIFFFHSSDSVSRRYSYLEDNALLLLAVQIVPAIIVLARFVSIGTLFPAIIHGGDASSAAAEARGEESRLFFGLLGAAVIIAAPVTLIALLGEGSFEERLRDITRTYDLYSDADAFELYLRRTLDPLFAGFNLLVSAVSVYAALVYAVTLSEHYARAEIKRADVE